MTTSTTPLAPFQDNSTAKNPDSDFLIRTMKDDLELLQKNGVVISEKTDESKPETSPSVSSLNESTPLATRTPAPTPSVFSKTNDAQLSPPFEEKGGLVEVSASQKSSPETTNSYRLILILISVLILAILGLGAFYFWLTRTPAQTPAPAVEVVVTEPIIEPVAKEETPVIITPTEKYSTSKPNFLVLEMTSAEKIKEQLITISNEVKPLNATPVAYEFVPTDTSNNPLSLQDFIAITKLNLSPIIMSSLAKNFSIFIFNDKEKTRLGLAIKTTNASKLASELKKQENMFPANLAFLLLSSKTETVTGLFKDGSYATYKTRYLNLNSQTTLSIDYALADDTLFIGTSKDTLRAILDKQKQATAPVSEKVATNAFAIGTCVEFPNKLATCTPFTCKFPHPLTGEQMERKIAGIIEGKCNYIEQMPNGGSMECNYTDDLRARLIVSFKEFASTGNASFSIKSDLTTTTTTSTVNDKADPAQEALDLKQCIITGYGN